MKHFFTYLLTLSICLLCAYSALSQDDLNPSRVLWSAPLSASTVKTVVDAGGNTWALSSPNTFQVIDPLGKVRWTKTLSALTVADFAVEPQGQLLLVGIPATGQPVLEKYDATQTLAWRNVLDSLSNTPGQVGNLSVTLTSTGNGIVLGLNAKSDRKLSYYAFGAGGKIQTVRSIQRADNGPVRPITPISYDQTKLLLGLNRSDGLSSFPEIYQVKVDSLNVVQTGPVAVVTSSITGDGPYPSSPVTWTGYPFIPNSKTPFIQLRYSYRKGGSGADSSTIISGYKLSTFFDPGTFPKTATDSDLAAVAESISRVTDQTGTLYTSQAVSSTSGSGTRSDLFVNQYIVSEFLRLKSLKVGTDLTPAGTTQRGLTVLKATQNGSLLLWGTTSGTMTIGQQTYTGSQERPTHFIVALGPEIVNQTLSADQVRWTTALPADVRKVRANTLQNSWVQLPDSTFRLYDAGGRQVWQKRLATKGIYDFGADSKANLYVAGSDTVSCFDSTGALRWKYAAGYKGAYSRGSIGQRLLAIRPNGGGTLASMDFVSNSGGSTELSADEFGPQGNSVGFKQLYYGPVPFGSGTLNSVLLQSETRSRFVVDAVFTRNGNTTTSHFVDYSNTAKTLAVLPITLGGYPVPMYTTKKTHGTSVWSGFANNITYASVKHLYVPFGGGVDVLYSYGFSQYDSTGKTIFDEVNTPRVNAIALAKARAVNPAGTLFTLNTTSQTETGTTTSYDLVLTEYSSTLALRNTTRLGTFTLVNGQTDKTNWELVQAYTDGSLLLSGITSGTLTIGNNTYAGSSTTPVRFLTLINSVVAQVTAHATAVCQGSNAVLKSRYKGYLAQAPIIQLSNAQGSFTQPSLSLQVPLSQSASVDTTLSAVSLPIPATLAAGTYRVRTLVGTLVSELASLTVTATPAAPTAKQEGDDLVGTVGSGTYQWYDAQDKPIAGATNTRYKPQSSGSYYLVNMAASGCASAPSNRIAFLILATEPTATIEIYPNPAADQLFVRWPAAGAGGRIRLLNTQGRVMQEVARQGEVTNVPTQGLASGLVVVQLQAEGQPILVRKVLIQK